MPTLTLSWTDLALFGLTAGLIGGIVLIGRSNSSPNVTGPHNLKKNAAPKKKKKPKKGGEPISSPPLSSPSAKRRESSAQSPPPTQPITTPESHPEPPSAVQSQAVEAKPATGPSPAQKKKAAKKAADTINDQDFPPLASAKDESHNKTNQNKPKRPFAERHQQPVRKTIVDDMIDEDVQKPLKMARVMNIVNPESEAPLSPASDPEDGWEKVPDSKRSRTTGISISIGTGSSGQPAAKPKQAAEQATSKRQRQNAKKKEAAKALKAAEEAERLSHLSAHKREQERIRMNAQTRSPQPSATSSKPLGKKVASASVAEDGRLIWE
ncbi:hypothetical protein PGT21_026696 [Puccinia graminis f. sp. tritici]|uniref:Uncharacterized protein n=2 Tax=Puccinia graminis f. sp. tritici TaxID=56615 RepID=E3KDW7_PUCGT|nr:uncharacterized protein PGTG_08298 [Puccinia graminis f. sp. tritici CRL 75-36-700-3]EFP82342.1 hypothetical protein PGTG_08298 [Puccinia graminis f. sp. tritici CRL 75-36-700-3]KAA1079889.1 hypothetical protein PGT21_026696 [Puccinia graminis f. sp. tritici]